jgi:hypothetical protein
MGTMTDDLDTSVTLSSPSSKLFIRSEVLAATHALSALSEPSKQDKARQVKRLMAIDDQKTVQHILLKELRGVNTSSIRVLTEFLMELGNIEVLQAPLWDLIQSATVTDEVKDAANLILRHLGDQTDPSVYLEYLDDPAALISRETERLLEVSSRNPEALIDFIDFIFSLPVDEQVRLIQSLYDDYSTEYLIQLFLPIILALPPLESLERLLQLLGEIRSPVIALFLHENAAWFESKKNLENKKDLKTKKGNDNQKSPQNEERLAKAWKKSVSTLKIAGLYREERFEETRAQNRQTSHGLIQQSTLYQCFATIPDGIGNQGLIVSRERENGDILMMSVAINDLHGIIDCFGFYELARPDFHKLLEKFHEESSKIQVPASYCLHKLRQAETVNRRNRFRIPYEFSCWKVLLDDAIEEERQFPDLIMQCQTWANTRYDPMSANLYHHPDFCAWFLEEGDHPVVTETMAEVLSVCQETMTRLVQATENQSPTEAIKGAFIEKLDLLALAMLRRLLTGEWRGILTARLADAAYLLQAQKATTFSALAATQVGKLLSYEGEESEIDGFIRHYGRRCIEEDLLRLRQETPQFKDCPYFSQLVESVMNAWELDPS